MRYRILFLPILLAVIATGTLYAADINRGKSLQQKNCMGCHDDGMYTRDNRRVSSLDGLQKQVKRCELALGLKWFDEDIAAVTEYLNTTYYHYK